MMHTSGEWKVERTKFGNVFIVAGEEHKHSLIADIADANDDFEANAHLIVASVNACSQVNPDNPQAVAESIGDMYEALKSWDELRAMQPLDSGADIDAILQECAAKTDKAIIKAEGK